MIGGGAAGFFGAITCAATYRETQVTLLEAARTPLAKVRISGGGRCNVTHHCFDPLQLVQNYPRGGKALRGAFSRFQPQNTIAWFQNHGVELKTEADGRMFPVTDDSETIVNCLLQAANQVGVKLRTAAQVKSIKKLDSRFEITLKTGEKLASEIILLATGSNPRGYHFAQSLGHNIVSPVPSLFTFNLADSRLHDLAGISVEKAHLRLLTPDKKAQKKLLQTGALLITHWGISGPAVLKLSAWGARILHEYQYQIPLEINWLPEYNWASLSDYFLAIKNQYPRRQIVTNSPVNLPKRLWRNLVLQTGISEQQRWAELSKKMLNNLVQELIQGTYKIEGKGVFKEEFVTCGGVNLKEINFQTMSSKICPGLYFAGEILDIDGVTGGFNFQNAWTTGWLAGQAMGKDN